MQSSQVIKLLEDILKDMNKLQADNTHEAPAHFSRNPELENENFMHNLSKLQTLSMALQQNASEDKVA